MRLPASLTPLAIVAALVTGGLVAAVAGISGGRAIMPGPLHGPGHDGEAHGGIRAHAEIDDCEGCHPGPFASQTASDKCLACHDDIAADLRDPTTLHGRVGAQGRCIQCHTEHRGRDAKLNRVDRDHFDHEASGFSLLAHEKTHDGHRFGCNDCHHGNVDHFAPGECEACHRRDDAAFVARHELAWGNGCRGCHDGVDRFDHQRFDHRRTAFALVGKHANVACERCHTVARALEGYGRAPAACDACHARDDVHQGRFGSACGTCHTPAGWNAIVPGSFDHGRTRFPLTGAHRTVACADCHRQGRLRGTPLACEGCHPRPRNHFAGTCDRCHDTTRWRDAHAPSRLPSGTTTTASPPRPSYRFIR